jgi:hypothetical protein
MSEKQMRRLGDGRSLLVAATVLCIVLVTTSSVVYAAPAPTAAASVSARPVTILDPFTLSIITASNPQPSVKATVPSVLFVRPVARHPVRIPVKPHVRSAFQPVR